MRANAAEYVCALLVLKLTVIRVKLGGQNEFTSSSLYSLAAIFAHQYDSLFPLMLPSFGASLGATSSNDTASLPRMKMAILHSKFWVYIYERYMLLGKN